MIGKYFTKYCFSSLKLLISSKIKNLLIMCLVFIPMLYYIIAITISS